MVRPAAVGGGERAAAPAAAADEPPGLELSGLFFAYGPDLDPQVLRSRGGRPEAVGVARLADHRLAFFGYTETWDSGRETVVSAPGEEVWGVLYRMGALDWERLDSWMGARMDGGGMYFHCPVVVTDLQGGRHWVRLYKKDVQGPPELPSLEYLALVVRGAGQQGLPADYLARLRRMVSRKASFPVPAPGNPDRGLHVLLDCNACEAGAEEVGP